MAHQWRGVVREYAERLPVTAETKVITLGEGGTPLVFGAPLPPDMVAAMTSWGLRYNPG